MKKFTKKTFALILALALAFTTICSVAINAVAAAKSTPGDNLSYSFNKTTGVFTITYNGSGKGDMYDFIGTNIGGSKPPWIDIKPDIKEVVIGEGVTTIGTFAFAYCDQLTKVTLPSTLKSIHGSGSTGALTESSNTLSYGAFRECTALESIVLPEGLEEIQTAAFRDCKALKSITFPDSLTTLGNGPFTHCENLRTVKFGTGLKNIPLQCFYGCTKLANVTSWGSVEELASYSFYGTGFDFLTLSENISSVGIRAFADCYSLLEAVIPNRQCSIDGEYAFHQESLRTEKTVVLKGHTGSTVQEYAEKNGYPFQSLDSCAHKNTHFEVTTPATCTTAGSQNTVCDDCGDIVLTSTIDATGHTYDEDHTVIQDDTTKDGHIRTTKTCVVCGDVANEITHVRLPNESGDGTSLNSYVWVDGYYTYTNTATCTSTGRETYTCTVEGCGTTVRDTFVPTTEFHIVPRSDHQVEEWTVVKKPTCTEAGSRVGVCTVCKDTITEDVEPTGHIYDKEKPISSETKQGHVYTRFNCDVCGAETVEVVHSEWIEGDYTSNVVTRATCTIDGTEKDTCDICGEVRYVSIPSRGGHVWVETSRQEPDCTQKGQINYACENCNLTKADRTEALGHELVKRPANSVEPTCTEAGYDYFECNRCSYSNQEVLPALGHYPTEESYHLIKAATCEEDGSFSGICVDCGVEFNDVIPKTGHEYEPVLKPLYDKPGHALSTPTCVNEGCNSTQPATVVHNQWIPEYYERTVITDATCITGEVSVDKCTICNETRTNNEGAPLGHEFGFVTVKLPRENSLLNSVNKNDENGGSGLGGLLDKLPSSNEDGSGSNIGDIIGGIGDTIDENRIEDYSMVYICRHCATTEAQPVRAVNNMWNDAYYNMSSKYRVGMNYASYLDVTGDGFINAKDYAKIKNVYKAYLNAQAAAEQQ